MSGPRVLVADGNVAETRELVKARIGYDFATGYANVLKRLAPDLLCDLIYPADAAFAVPAPAELTDYSGFVVTGSALNIYNGGAEVERQLELARVVFESGLPFFGSCWGLQIAVTVAGGSVVANPRGREFGFGRRISLTPAGHDHRMYAGKPAVFEAATVHRDSIERLPSGAEVLAINELGIQAAAFAYARGQFWGVQYHPEYEYRDLITVTDRYASRLVSEGLFHDERELEQYKDDLARLDRNPDDRALLWKHGLGPGISNWTLKVTELRNWIDAQVRPRHRRGP